MNDTITTVSGYDHGVSDAVLLETGLYILDYEYTADDTWVILNITLESFEDSNLSQSVDGGRSGVRKGRKYSGRQSVRVTKPGKYLVTVEGNDAIDWTIKLIRP